MSSSPIPIATQFRISMKDVEEVARFFLRRVFRFPASSISACVSVCQDLEENMFITPCLVRARCNLFLLSKFLPQWSQYANVTLDILHKYLFSNRYLQRGQFGSLGGAYPSKTIPFRKKVSWHKIRRDHCNDERYLRSHESKA